MPWYKKDFEVLFMGHGNPRGAGLFAKSKSGSVDSHVLEFYFSPVAAKIAMPLIQRYNGLQCPAPSRSEVTILVVDAARMDDIPFTNASANS